jgi:hypothetical protein
MKTNRNLLMQLTLNGVLAVLAHAASAQTWQTVDDFTYAGTGLNRAAGLTLDPFGNVFVAGWGADANGLYHALIRKSSDAGATWSLVDDLASPGGWAFYGVGLGYLLGGGIGSDTAGNVYGAGVYSAANGNVWFVSKSATGGADWANVDTAGPVAWAADVAADAGGNVYVVGRTNATWITTTTNKNGTITTSTNTGISWLARKGTGGGTSWATADQPFPGYATAVYCHPTAGVFVTGRDNSSNAWVTRRSFDAGSTWTTVDSVAAGPGSSLGGDALGNIYVTGTSSDQKHWLVRKSSDGGNSWTTVDDFSYCVTTTSTKPPYKTSTTCYTAIPSGFAADSNGNLFVVGYVNSSQWIVRENPGGNTAWQTVDSTISGQAFRIAADSSGHVYVAGPAQGHWIVRKR